MDNDVPRDAAVRELQSVQRMGHIAAYLYESGDTEAAFVLCRHIIRRTEELFSTVADLNKESAARLGRWFSEHLPDFDKDKEFVSKIVEAGGLPAEDDAELISVVTRVSKYPGLVLREAKSVLGVGTDFFAWLSGPLRLIGLSCLSFVLILALVYAVVYLSQRRGGVTGDYFDGKNFDRLVKTRRDKNIDFKWGEDAPIRALKQDLFSVRWTGFLWVDKPGTYTFTTSSDDGVRLWIDGVLLVDNWTIHGEMVDSGAANLSSGYHSVKLEYFENRRTATIQLYWKHDAILEKRIIPHKNFFRWK